ncbi:translation initiation factor IF-2-like [Meles meles]|uniref:translation initiation factor IF-2-like n=1 Tax=Meles meles TaxID=9662 RepID=UPI001E69E52E|nr:translation initiation factor IF-2-like [Meles meles]XP_045838207.1 translation initiation factor IF-2-like [Meles meles]XP_045838208.1 translation initiation factor IF-2-like [Meles meles]XP_045838209.1 translation initiation factor IF-2-like [Meles meles]XP_045838210.1 translation initiation factor IF-2-like [Meles meles]XP_045838211.1 translation initiation factor IF-2-like [Meles meles]XP_045838212.1 translation initiation factor IF-2-like [Meles meles]XP_045838213.1 translation initi
MAGSPGADVTARRAWAAPRDRRVSRPLGGGGAVPAAAVGARPGGCWAGAAAGHPAAAPELREAPALRPAPPAAPEGGAGGHRPPGLPVRPPAPSPAGSEGGRGRGAECVRFRDALVAPSRPVALAAAPSLADGVRLHAGSPRGSPEVLPSPPERRPEAGARPPAGLVGTQPAREHLLPPPAPALRPKKVPGVSRHCPGGASLQGGARGSLRPRHSRVQGAALPPPPASSLLLQTSGPGVSRRPYWRGPEVSAAHSPRSVSRPGCARFGARGARLCPEVAGASPAGCPSRTWTIPGPPASRRGGGQGSLQMVTAGRSPAGSLRVGKLRRAAWVWRPRPHNHGPYPVTSRCWTAFPEVHNQLQNNWCRSLRLVPTGRR